MPLELLMRKGRTTCPLSGIEGRLARQHYDLTTHEIINTPLRSERLSFQPGKPYFLLIFSKPGQKEWEGWKDVVGGKIQGR